jgi:hypothetical protein
MRISNVHQRFSERVSARYPGRLVGKASVNRSIKLTHYPALLLVDLFSLLFLKWFIERTVAPCPGEQG